MSARIVAVTTPIAFLTKPSGVPTVCCLSASRGADDADYRNRRPEPHHSPGLSQRRLLQRDLPVAVLGPRGRGCRRWLCSGERGRRVL